jgi:hypothetical protein
LADDSRWWIILCVQPEGDRNQASPSRSRVKVTGEVLLWLAVCIPLALFVLSCCLWGMFRLFDSE